MNDFVEIDMLRAMRDGKLVLSGPDAKKDQEIQPTIADYFGG